MKQLYYILLLLPLLLCACDKDNEGGKGINVEPDNFIHFTSNIDAKGTTRAPIITNMRGKEFAVLGYEYPKTTLWNAYKALATPNVFAATPQSVSCSTAGVCTYTNIKEWGNDKAYTFFAYFPINTAVKYNGNNSSYKGVPYIEYDLPTSSDPDDLLDVMYAQSNENMLGSNSSTVKLQFNHALFCLFVQAMNLNDEDVKIKNVNFTINSIQHTHLHLNLDGTPYMVDKVDQTYSGGSITGRTYTILDDDNEITIPPISSTNPNATDVSNYKDASFTNDNNIMLIPQSEMSGKITLIKDGTSMEQEFTSDIDFKPGRKYAVSISFAGDAMSIKIIDSDEWTDSTSDIEFE